MFISNAYAQSPASPGLLESLTSGGAPIFILMFVVMYFMMIRPQMRRQKEQQALIAAIAKGNEVVTASGILGKVTKVTDVYVTLEVAAGTEIIVQKSAVTTLLPTGTIKAI